KPENDVSKGELPVISTIILLRTFDGIAVGTGSSCLLRRVFNVSENRTDLFIAQMGMCRHGDFVELVEKLDCHRITSLDHFLGILDETVQPGTVSSFRYSLKGRTDQILFNTMAGHTIVTEEGL